MQHVLFCFFVFWRFFYETSNSLGSHLPLVCIYVERPAFELEFSHLIPVQERVQQHQQLETQRQKATGSLNINDKTI